MVAIVCRVVNLVSCQSAVNSVNRTINYGLVKSHVIQRLDIYRSITVIGTCSKNIQDILLVIGVEREGILEVTCRGTCETARFAWSVSTSDTTNLKATMVILRNKERL